ncbi:MAG: 16S rRNA (guanine(527)-N(7))-methyltransferase RsmG [Lentisphaeria bacterium]|nr:16S rRNA (guanine(527)-N(7))-methyltransferase RsmG [Lentisphaeria bacterium]
MNFSLAGYASCCGVPDPEGFAEKCRRLRELLVVANEKVNLTRITGEEDFAVKHAADSLELAACFPEFTGRTVRIADLGCGAGFPSLILGAAFPIWRITAIDSTGKKTDFVRAAAQALGLDNVTPVHGRVNELNRKSEFQGKFDIVTARAVAVSPSLVKDASHFPAPSGCFIFYKTPRQAEEELPLLKKDFRDYDWRVTPPRQLPCGAGTRLFIVGRPR